MCCVRLDGASVRMQRRGRLRGGGAAAAGGGRARGRRGGARRRRVHPHAFASMYFMGFWGSKADRQKRNPFRFVSRRHFARRLLEPHY